MFVCPPVGLTSHWRSQDFVLRGPEKTGVARILYPPPQPTRGSGEHRKLPQAKMVHFELEKTNVVMTNLIFFCHFYSAYLELNLQD